MTHESFQHTQHSTRNDRSADLTNFQLSYTDLSSVCWSNRGTMLKQDCSSQDQGYEPVGWADGHCCPGPQLRFGPGREFLVFETRRDRGVTLCMVGNRVGTAAG